MQKDKICEENAHGCRLVSDGLVCTKECEWLARYAPIPIMAQSLIVGGDSFLGRHLHAHIGGEFTSRRAGAKNYFDYLWSSPSSLPAARVIYLVGGITKFKPCETDPDAYRINVDAQVAIAAHHEASHIVYVSSEAAEWPNQTAYGAQKRACELALMAICYKRLSIVRPGQIRADNVNEVCALIADVANERRTGVARWWPKPQAKAAA